MRRYILVLAVGILLLIGGFVLVRKGREQGGVLRQPQLMTVGGLLLLAGVLATLLTLRLLIKALARWAPGRHLPGTGP